MKANSSFTNVSINVVGPSGRHRDKSYNSSETMNFMLERHQSGSSQALLAAWPGSVSYQQISTSPDRGAHFFNGFLYKISGTTLYQYDINKTETIIGTIAGSGRCVMVSDQNFMAITAPGIWYSFDKTTLTEIAEPSYFASIGFTRGNTVDIIGGFFVFDCGSNNYAVSDFGNPNSILEENTNKIASKSGNLKRVYFFDEALYLLSEKNIETHYLDGVSNPPVRKVQNGTMEVGLKDIHSVAHSVNQMYWRGSNGYVYKLTSTQAQNITSGAAANAFETYAEDTATAYVIDIQGAIYYVITFTQNNATWVFSESEGELTPGVNNWFQLSTGADSDRYIGDFYVNAFKKHLICKKNSGDILELDIDTYTDDGDNIVRMREIPPIHGGLLDKTGEGRNLEASWFTIKGRKGTGLMTGQGVDPRVYLQISTDGGQSFSNQEHVEIGRLGETNLDVTWYFTESFYEATIRIVFYDPVFASIHSASMGLKLLGD